MFNNNTPERKPLVICLFPFGQFMVFTWLYLNETICRVLFYPRSASSGIELLMPFPIVSLYALKSCSVPSASCTSMMWWLAPLNDDLGFQRMPFFSWIIRFLVLFRAVYRTFRHIYHNVPDWVRFSVVGERCCLPNNYLEKAEVNNNSDNDFVYTMPLGKMNAFPHQARTPRP
jgi:hypothetical protein